MRYTIRKTFGFSASHRLDKLPPDHQCFRDHGHNYKLTVELAWPTLDPAGMVFDYGKLDCIKDDLKVTFDHRHFNNDIFPNGELHPTAENLAAYFYGRFQGILHKAHGARATRFLMAVALAETDETWAEFRPGLEAL